MRPASRRTEGVARQFSEARFGAPTRPIETSPTLNGTDIEIAGNNPDRIFLSIANTGQQVASFAFDRGHPVAAQQPLAPGGTLQLTLEEDGDVVTRPLYGTWNGTSTTLYVLEVEAT